MSDRIHFSNVYISVEKKMEDETMTTQPTYFAIIPAHVRYAKTISANAKLLYGDISALCHQQGYCWASNDYFARLYDVSKTSISKWINQLKEQGFVTVELHYKKDSKEIDKRHIKIVEEPMKQNEFTSPTNVIAPIEEKFKENKTVNTKKNKTMNKKHPYTKEHMRLAKMLHINLSKDFPKEMSKVNLNVWASEMNLLNRQDGVRIEDIAHMINWLTTNDFWSRHIRHPKKLRETFERLVVESKKGKTTTSKTETLPDWFNQSIKETPASEEEMVDIKQKILAFQMS